MKSVAIGLLLSCSLAAQAAVIDLSSETDQTFEVQSKLVNKGSFTTRYDFVYSGLTKVLLSLQLNEFKVGTSRDIVWSSFKILDSSGAVVVEKTSSDALAVNSPLSGGGFVQYVPDPVAAFGVDSLPITSSFSFVLSGQTIGEGPIAGSYTLLATASPVPEPETYALLLLGLGAVGAFKSRRSEFA